ncbi:MAG: DUF58 domain-containing protein [Planctomycetota bacterium]
MSATITVDIDDLVWLNAEARGFSFLPRQPVSSLLAGRHTSRLRGRGLAFRELRHYQQGDDIRTIDWKATARLRSPFVRVYDEERERPVLLVVDQRSPMFFGSRRSMKSVAAAELTALAAWRALDSGDRVGGIVFNESERVIVRPHRSQTRTLHLLHEVVRFNQRLAKSEKPTGNVTLNDALEAAVQSAKHDHLVVVISDLDGANETTKELSTRLAAHNDVLIVAIYDPLGASLRGDFDMTAYDRGASFNIPLDAGFSDRFRGSFQRLLDQWTEIFRMLKVPVLPVSTAEPVSSQIRSLFGHTLPK